VSLQPAFRVASEAASQSLEFLHVAEIKAHEGEESEAISCLKAVAILAGTDLHRVISESREELACVSVHPYPVADKKAG
jgi:hypothetical protein